MQALLILAESPGLFPGGMELWPLLILAASYSLLLVVVIIIAIVQSRRLSKVSRHLVTLSIIVQRQTRAVEQLSELHRREMQQETYAQEPEPVEEEQEYAPSQSDDGVIDLRERLQALRREIESAAATKD